MTRIRFTIGDSTIWHEIQLENYQLTKLLFRDEHDLSYIIKQGQVECQKGKAKKVEVLDENGVLLAKSDDILQWDHLEYIGSDGKDS